MVQDGEEALKHLTHPYLLTIYSVICGLSIASEYQLTNECKKIEGVTFPKYVYDYLVKYLYTKSDQAREKFLDDILSKEGPEL